MQSAVSLVTGSSSGFGLLSAIELARRGCRVFASMRNLERQDRLQDAARAAGVAVEAIRLDVTDSSSISSAVAEIERRAGRVDVLVNNAGFGLAGFLEDVSIAEMREQFETNFFGLVELTAKVIPGMRERRYGRIINVSSLNGAVAMPGLGAYCASKFALEGYSESLWHELLPYGVHVAIVQPGTFRTDIFERNRRVAQAADSDRSPYYALAKRMERLIDARVARSKADPAQVARVIAEIATAKPTQLRYPVGVDAALGRLVKTALPSRAWARAVQLALGIGGR